MGSFAPGTGNFTLFDVPGAGTGPGQGTFPYSNNPDDAITGWEIDANGVYHGFLRFHEDDRVNEAVPEEGSTNSIFQQR
jgi:hypothetical protein